MTEQAIQRFWAKVDQGIFCWDWRGAQNSRGYGCLRTDKTPWLAHRFAYIASGRSIPEGYQIDHLCRNKLCVRPDHLEAVTAEENNRRSLSPTAVNRRKTHCKRGHALSGDNLYVYAPRGNRTCRTCHNETNRRSRERAA